MNNERLFTKSPNGNNQYIDSLNNSVVLLSNIKVTSILENGNKVLGTLNTVQHNNSTTINKTTVVAAAVHNQQGHSTGSMIGAGLAGAALGAGVSYLLNRDLDGDTEQTQSTDDTPDSSGDDYVGTVSDDDEE